MTDTIAVLIGSGGSVHDVSNRIKFCTFTQRPATNGIGTWQLVLDNCDSGLNGLFAGDDPIAISINSAEILTGYLDKGATKLRGVSSNYIYLSGRDSGQDTQNKLLWSLYAHTDAFSGKADDIIEDMLSQTSSEIGFTSPSTAPEIYYSANWLALADQFKEVLESINYIGFTDKDLAFQIWDIATGRDSGITLKSLPNDSTNNVIGEIDYESGDTTDVTNYLIVEGPKTNDDAYTEMTAAGWTTVEVGNIISDYTGTSPTPKKGAAAIKCTASDGKHASFVLSFPKYWLWWLDCHLIASDDLKFSLCMHTSDGLSAPDYLGVFIKDSDGNVMEWDEANVGRRNRWAEIKVKVGYNEDTNAKWVASVGAKADFNWYITEIKIMFYRDAVPGTLQDVLLDGLVIPVPIVAASDQTVGSCVHTLRECKLSRTDITSQVELQQFADQLAPKLAAAMSYLNLTAVGNAGLIAGVWKWLPGYYAKANIKDRNGNYLVPLNSKWRFMELTHVFNPDQPKQGHIYWVELKMVPYDAIIDNKRYSYATDDPNNPVSKIRMVRDRLRYIENTASGNIEPRP